MIKHTCIHTHTHTNHRTAGPAMETAIERIESDIDVVGLTERMEEFVVMLYIRRVEPTITMNPRKSPST